MEDRERTVGVFVHLNGHLDKMPAMALLRDLQHPSLVAHGVVITDDALMANAQDLAQRAKERHGLKALLLGEVDPAELEREGTSGDSNGTNGTNGANGKHELSDVTVAAAKGLADPPARMPSARQSYAVKCPECGGDLDMGEGCVKCHGCGFSQC